MILVAALAGCAQPGVRAPDESLTTDEYIARGLPSPSRTWGVQDYAQAAKVLRAVAQEDAGLLPKHGSGKSGEVFARLVAPENLAAFRSRSGEPEERFRSAGLIGLELGPVYADIVKTYDDAGSRRAGGKLESVELLGFALRMVALQASLVTQADVRRLVDMGRPELAQSYRYIQDQLAATVLGTIGQFEDPQYTDADRVRLAGVARETLPALAPALPRAARIEANLRMQSLSERYFDKDLRRALEALRDEFVAAPG